MNQLKDVAKKHWLQQRQKGIGGSESSAILGKNPYLTNVELWEIKTELKKGEQKYTQAMKYGNESENLLIKLFALDYPDYEVWANPHRDIIRNRDHPFILGTVDATLARVMKGSVDILPEYGFLEIKTSTIYASQAKEVWTNKVPENYFIQVLHYFLINKEFEFAVLKVQLKSAFDKDVYLITRHYHFERKDYLDDIEYLRKEIVEFWEVNVLKKIEPALRLPQL